MVWTNWTASILTTLIVNFKGGPVGLDTLAAAIGEDSGTLEDVYEPYLLKNGFFEPHPERADGLRTCLRTPWFSCSGNIKDKLL